MSIKLWNAETQTADNLIGSQIENNIIDDTTASTDKVYSSSKVEDKLKNYEELPRVSNDYDIEQKGNYIQCQTSNLSDNSLTKAGCSHLYRLESKIRDSICYQTAQGIYGSVWNRVFKWWDNTWMDWTQLTTTYDVYGAELTRNEDLNYVLTRKSTSGTAIVQSLINRPSDSSATECCVYFDSCGTSNLYGVQHFIGINAAANTYNEWVRIKNDSSWNAWKKLF